MSRLSLFSLLLGCWFVSSGLASPTRFAVSADLEVGTLQRLLHTYVDDQGRVNYSAWRQNPADRQALDAWLGLLAPVPANPAETGGAAHIAGLVNAYNAFTLKLILDHPEAARITDIPGAWKKKQWPLAGREVSLDEIEHEALRPLYGWRVHALIVCAAASCPPLQREAFTAANLESLGERAWTTWLGRPDLNGYDPTNRRVDVSSIFQWFSQDFVGDGALSKILVRYGPPELRSFFERGEFSVHYRGYDWQLNAQR